MPVLRHLLQILAVTGAIFFVQQSIRPSHIVYEVTVQSCMHFSCAGVAVPPLRTGKSAQGLSQSAAQPLRTGPSEAAAPTVQPMRTSHLYAILSNYVYEGNQPLPAWLALPTNGISAQSQVTETELSLQDALNTMPDTPTTRSVGIWYSDYSRAERTYGIRSITTTTDSHIGRYFTAIRPLRPGPETGVSALYTQEWRHSYGYDLFNLTSEIYTLGYARQAVAIAAGNIGTEAINHLLTTAGYTASIIGKDRLFIRMPLLDLRAPNSIMNAVAVHPNILIAGARPKDAAVTLQQLQRRATLGIDATYQAIAAALGSVEGAYIAANVSVPRFATPSAGHSGPPLSAFNLYAVAYQEPHPGQHYMELALAYQSAADAQNDAPILYARLQAESLPVYGRAWKQIADVMKVTTQGPVVLARLRLRSTVPPTLWQDAVLEGDLSILSS